MKKWQYIFLAFLAVGTVIILSQSKQQSEQGELEYRSNQGTTFGTSYHITYLYTRDLQPEIEQTLQQVDNALSMFNTNSVISKVNNSLQVQVTDTMFLKVFNDKFLSGIPCRSRSAIARSSQNKVPVFLLCIACKLHSISSDAE